jgi:hypothetical protein
MRGEEAVIHGFIVLAVLAFLGSLYFLLARRPAPPSARRDGV